MNYIKAKRKLKLRQNAYEIFLLIIGCFVMACGTSFFLLPNQLSTGGFTGIATIFYYFLKFPLGTTMFVLNIPFFIWSYFRIGKKFILKSLIGTFTLSFFLNLLTEIPVMIEDKFLASIYGGIIIGLGLAIVLKSGASTGGSDLLIYLIRSYKPNFQASSIIVIIDVIIVGLNVIFFKNLEIGLYSAVAIYILGKMIDIVFEGINFTKIIFIISDKYRKISKEIETKTERGNTGIYTKGMYTNEDRMMLMCVGNRNEVARIKKIALDIDKRAFIIITNAREIFGKGFKKASS